MEKIVVDTNVFINAIQFNPVLVDADVIPFIADINNRILWDNRIIQEYEFQFQRPKFQIPRNIRDELVFLIKSEGQKVDCREDYDGYLPDTDDMCFLEVAINGGADYLISNNIQHLPSNYQTEKIGLHIVSPFEFLRMHGKR